MQEARKRGRGFRGARPSHADGKEPLSEPRPGAMCESLEVPLAYLLTILAKERVIEVYLNIAQWGPGIFGAEAASHISTSASQLTRRDPLIGSITPPQGCAIAASATTECCGWPRRWNGSAGPRRALGLRGTDGTPIGLSPGRVLPL